MGLILGKSHFTFVGITMPQFQQHTEELPTHDSIMVMRLEPQSINWNTSPLASIPELKSEPPLPPIPFDLKTSEASFPLFYIYFGIVIVWSLFFQNNQKTVKNIALSMVSNSALFQMLNERRSFNAFISIGLFILGLIVLSIFSYQSLTVTSALMDNIELKSSQTYIFVILAVLISATFFKSLILGISGWVFNQEKAFSGYLSLNINSIQILGVILLPLSILITYGHNVNPLLTTVLGITLIVIVFLYRLVRTFFLTVKETNSQVFHIILYICALEILPLFVISKLILAS